MKIDLQELKRLAGEATPGPWRLAINDQTLVMANTHREESDVICDVLTVVGRATTKNFADAAHIAACSPEVIKALVDVVEASQKWLRDGAVGRGSVEHLNALTKALTPFTESTNEEA